MASKDQYGRKIDYIRISVTDKCNLRCSYCMPEEGVQHKYHTQILRNEQMLEVVKVAASEGVHKVRLTGGEPLVRRGIVELVRDIAHVPGIEEIAMTTNATLLVDRAQALKEAGLTRINISLDTLNPQTFKQITRGGDLFKALNGIDAAIEADLQPIKVNTVLIGGVNDHEVMDFIRYVGERQLDWRIIELMPIGEVADWSSDHFVSGGELLAGIPGMVKIPGTSGYRVKRFLYEPLNVRVGLIDAVSGKFCDSCNRLRLTSDGKVRPCLHSDLEYDVYPFIDDVEELRRFYRNCVQGKPKEHHITDDDYQPVKRNMNRIGG